MTNFGLSVHELKSSNSCIHRDLMSLRLVYQWGCTGIDFVEMQWQQCHSNFVRTKQRLVKSPPDKGLVCSAEWKVTQRLYRRPIVLCTPFTFSNCHSRTKVAKAAEVEQIKCKSKFARCSAAEETLWKTPPDWTWYTETPSTSLFVFFCSVSFSFSCSCRVIKTF